MSDVTTTTGVTGAGGGDMIRITGMNTGLDVDALVTKMMKAEQTKIDTAKKNKQLVEWKQEAYQTIIKDIKTFQSKYFDSLNKDTYVLSPDFFSSYAASSDDEKVVTAKAGVGAQTGTYEIKFEDGDHIASAATKSGGNLNAIHTDLTISTSTTMNELGLTSDGKITLNYNEAGSVSIDVKITDKLSDVINSISTKTNGDVTASFSQLTGKFAIKTSSTGSTKSLKVESESGDVLSYLGFSSAIDEVGTDALVHITPPGESTGVAVTKSTNTFTIDGITYNLLKKEDTSITVTQDADKTYDKINDFVKSYNSIVDEVEEKLGEKKDKNYPALTDAQKEKMSESQIKAWDDKAKVGVLRNDDNLQKLLTDLRSAFTTGVDGNTLTFGKYGTNAIGIDTNYDASLTDLTNYNVSTSSSSSSSYVTQGGKIYIADKTKLVDAIKNHSDELAKFFTATSDSTDKTQKYQKEGVLSRLNDIWNNNVGYTGTTLNSATLTKYANNRDDYSLYGASGDSTLPDQIYYKQKAVENLQSEYKTMQESYYEKFSKLETAMVTLNTQSSLIYSMLGQSS